MNKPFDCLRNTNKSSDFYHSSTVSPFLRLLVCSNLSELTIPIYMECSDFTIKLVERLVYERNKQIICLDNVRSDVISNVHLKTEIPILQLKWDCPFIVHTNIHKRW